MKVSIWRLPGMGALVALTVLGFSGYAALLPVAPLWAVHGGADPAGAGLVNGVVLAATVATQGLIPGALRRFGWGPVLVAGMVLLGAPSLALIVSDALPAILVASAVRGIGFGVLTVCGSAAVAELSDARRRGEAIGAYGLGVAVPNVAVLPLGPWVAEQAGFPVVFAVGAAPLLAIPPALRLAAVLHTPRGEAQPPPDAAGPSTGRALARLVRPSLVLLSVTIAGGAILTFAPQMVSPGLSTAALLLMGAVAAIARWRAGGLADSRGAQPFIAPLVALTAAGMASTAWALGRSGLLGSVAFLLAVAVVGLCYGALQNLTLVLAFEAVPPSRIGLASAVWNVGFDAGTGLGSVLVGALAAGWSFPVALVAVAAVSVVTIPLSLRRHRAA